MTSVPYLIRRPDNRIRSHLENRKNCYIQAPFKSGEKRLLTEAAIALRKKEPTRLVILCLEVILNQVKNNEQNQSARRARHWYLELCKRIDDELLLPEEKVNSQALIVSLKKRSESESGDDAIEADAILEEYLYEIITKIAAPSHLIFAFKNTDSIFLFDRQLKANYDANSQFARSFLQKIYQLCHLNKKNTDDPELERYRNISFVLTGSRPISDYTETAGIGYGILDAPTFADAFENIPLESFSLEALLKNKRLTEWRSPLGIKDAGIEYAYENLTNGHPALTIEALDFMARPGRYLRLEDELLPIWKHKLQPLDNLLELPENETIREIYRLILFGSERSVSYSLTNKEQLVLSDLGLVTKKADRLVVHNSIFEQICRSWQCFEIQPASPNESVRISPETVKVDETPESNLPPSQSSAAEDNPVENSTKPRPKVELTDTDRDDARIVRSPIPVYLLLTLSVSALTIAFQAYTLDDVRDFGIIALLCGLAITLGLIEHFRSHPGSFPHIVAACKAKVRGARYQLVSGTRRTSTFFKTHTGKLIRGLILAALAAGFIVRFWNPMLAVMLPAYKDYQINAMSTQSLESFDAGREIEGLKQAVAAGNSLKQVEKVRNARWLNYRRLPWASRGEMTYPRLILQYIYANIRQVDEFKASSLKAFYQATAFSENKIAASAAKDSDNNNNRTGDYLALWDGASGERFTAFRTNHGEIEDLSFDAEGKYIATAGKNGHIMLWKWDDVINDEANLANPDPYDKFTWNNPVNSVKFSPDNKYVAAFSSENELIIWPWNKENPSLTEISHSIVSPDRLSQRASDRSRLSISTVCIGAVKPDAEIEDRIQTWSISEKTFSSNSIPGEQDSREFAKFFGRKGYSLRTIAFSKNNKYLAVGGTKGDTDGFFTYFKFPESNPALCVPSISESSEPEIVDLENVAVSSIAIDEKGTLLIADAQGSFQVFPIAENQQKPIASSQVGRARTSSEIGLVPNPNPNPDSLNKFLVANRNADSIEMWSYGGSKNNYFRQKSSGFLPEGDRIKTALVRSTPHNSDESMAVLTTNGRLYALNDEFQEARRDSLQIIYTELQREGEILTDIALNVKLGESEKALAGITQKGSVVLFDWNADFDPPFPVSMRSPQQIRFVPNENNIIAVSSSTKVVFYDINSKQQSGDTLDTVGIPIKKIAFSPKGQYMLVQLVSALRLYDIRNGLKENLYIEIPEANTSSYKDIAFYPVNSQKDIFFATLQSPLENNESQLVFRKIKQGTDSETELTPASILELGRIKSQSLLNSGQNDAIKKLFTTKLLNNSLTWENIAFFDREGKSYLAISAQDSALAWDLTGLSWEFPPKTQGMANFNQQFYQKQFSKKVMERLTFVFSGDWNNMQSFSYDENHALLGLDAQGQSFKGRAVGLEETIDWGCEWLRQQYYIRRPDEAKQLCQ